MAQIVTITNPLTGQPAQVDQLDHTAQQIDDSIGRALPGGEIDTLLAGKAPSTYLGSISRNKIYKIGYFFKGSGSSSSGAVTIRIRNFSDYGKENYMLAFLGAYGFSTEYHGQITTTYISKISVYSDKSVTGSAKKYTVFVTTQDYVDWASVYIDNEHSFTRNFADVTDTFSALVDGLDKVWESEYEYLNPPMQLGVEYRTTERRNGLPVYTQFKNLGKIVNGAYGDISVTNLDSVVGYEAFWVNRPLPIIKNSSLTDAETQYVNVFAHSGTIIRVYYYGGANFSGNGDVYVLVKYTKST